MAASHRPTRTRTPTPSVTPTPAPGSGSLDVWFKAPLAGATISGTRNGSNCYVNGTGVTRELIAETITRAGRARGLVTATVEGRIMVAP